MSRTLVPLKRRIRTRQLKVTGEKLLAKVKEVTHEGNVRRITIKDTRGRSVLEVPLTAGALGALLRPTWVAIGAIAALASRHTLVVERVDGMRRGQLPAQDAGRRAAR